MAKETPLQDQAEIKFTDKVDKRTEKQFLTDIGKKQKKFLIDMDLLSKERVARHIKDLFDDASEKHQEIVDKIDGNDQVFRMERKEMINSDGDMPNYRSPLTASSLEVVHANIMNVFFTPANIMRVIPTEKNDIPKVNKLDTFGNWSMKNEMDLFNQFDKLNHSSAKNGESPYIVHWVKEYGIDIERKFIPDPDNPDQPKVDPDTQEPIVEERNVPKLLYNGPRLEVFSRKDYIQPKNALMDVLPDWEMRKVRITYDQYLKDQLQGKMYAGTLQKITDWGSEDSQDTDKIDFEGDTIPVGKWEKEFIEFYGKMRITAVKRDKDTKEVVESEEIEDEFIAIINIEDEVLCSLRRNKFPLKMRPLGIDYFIPDDEGRRAGIGMVEFMDSVQKNYDVLFNHFVFGTMQSNNPLVFFTPFGNQRDEPMRLRNGYAYPTADPSSVQIFQFPQPNESLQKMMELVRFWAQMLFGISDFQAGLESTIDPDAPAKKAQIVVAQGNVRMNMLIKRKQRTLQDIFKRWFLLYKENMPKDKFMRIVGDSKDNPWKFEEMTANDFALDSIPDFELVGNVLNSNKGLEAQKKIAIYNLLVTNPFFAPQSSQGLQSLHQLTKWLIDGLDETGLSSFLPQVGTDTAVTPHEENGLFMQGDSDDPKPGEDNLAHMRVHNLIIQDNTLPEEVRRKAFEHVQKHIEQMKSQIAQQFALQQAGINPNQNQGGNNAVSTGERQTTQGAPTNNVQQFAGVA